MGGLGDPAGGGVPCLGYLGMTAGYPASTCTWCPAADCANEYLTTVFAACGGAGASCGTGYNDYGGLPIEMYDQNCVSGQTLQLSNTETSGTDIVLDLSTGTVCSKLGGQCTAVVGPGGDCSTVTGLSRGQYLRRAGWGKLVLHPSRQRW